MHQRGITKNMVQNLSPGSTVVAHTAEMRSYISKMIVDLRGASFAMGVRVIVIRSPKDVEQIMGLRRPVALDHTFIDKASAPTMERVTRTIDGINMSITAAQAA